MGDSMENQGGRTIFEGVGGQSNLRVLPVHNTSGRITSSNVSTLTFGSEKKTKPKRKRNNYGTKKQSPGAPKRFKSSFIFFSMEKHREIKAKLAREGRAKNINITSLVSQAWRSLESTERERFENMARIDKERYDEEKRNYVPPTIGGRPPGARARASSAQAPTGTVTGTSTKRRRMPGAPKRPMSAYLAYANKLRGKVKRENPTSTNGEISKILSGMWKEIPEYERKKLKDDEKLLWDVYRIKMQQWRDNEDSAGTNARGRKSKKKKDRPTISEGLMDFSGSSHHVDMIHNDSNVDDHLVGLGSVPGMDSMCNSNTTDEMMAASALRGVRGGDLPSNNIDNNVYGSFFGVNHGQIETSLYGQYNYPFVGNSHAIAMAQLRGGSNISTQQYSGFMFDQQPNLSQLASLAGVQNDAIQGVAHQNNIGNSVLDDNSDHCTANNRVAL